MYLKPGSIHTISYVFKKRTELPESKRQEFHLNNSSAYIEKFLMDMVFNPRAAADPNSLYATSRKDTHQLISDFENNQILIRTYVQVGQKESLQEINRIEGHPDFVQWMDPMFIEDFKNSK